MPKPWENSEGYPDPTAYHGTKAIIREEAEESKRLSAVVGTLKGVAALADFEIVGRIVLRDRCTGKEYR